MNADNDPGIADVLTPGLSFALTRLVAGKVGAIAFVEIGPDALALEALGTDACGVPVLRPGASHGMPWTAVLPELPILDAPRHRLMAGDIDAIPGGTSIDAAMPPKLELLTQMAGVGSRSPGRSWRLDIVLVNRACSWPLLDAAVVRARTVLRPITEIIVPRGADDLPKLIRDLAAQAPLRYCYDLVVAEVDPVTRVVRPRTRPLFPAGTAVRPGASPEMSITVSPVPGHAASALALPIVARRGPVSDLRDVEALAEHRPEIMMTGLTCRVSGPVELRVTLTAPGYPRIMPPQRAFLTTAGEPGWPELMKELPRRLPLKNPPWLLSRSGYLDLAVLVELSGSKDVVAARVGLARTFVGLFQGVRDVMIAAVGYRDHFSDFSCSANWERGREAEALLVGCRGLGIQADAASALAEPGRWDAAPLGRHPQTAPLEDALRFLTEATWGWRPHARHVVVVIGSRPPHPALSSEAERYEPAPRPCPLGGSYSWRTALARIQKNRPADRYTVLDNSSAAAYEADVWREFGAKECFRLGRGSSRRLAERLAQACGLTPSPRIQIRLAMSQAPASCAAAGFPSGRAAR